MVHPAGVPREQPEKETAFVPINPGDWEGPNSPYVKLISSDGKVFFIERDHAMKSGTLKAMLTNPEHFRENQTNEIHLEQISARILSCVCKYLAYNARYANADDPYYSETPDFEINASNAYELLLAAKYLNC